jgi:beta-lactamase class A
MSAIHLESNRRLSVNEGERFPMGSAFKVPLAVELLALVEKGQIRLDQMVAIQSTDLRPGSGILTDLLSQPGLALSVRNLMELMLLISDKTAADVGLRLVGGPEAVTARMRALGIEGMDINRSTAQLLADWVGVKNLPPEHEWSPALFLRLFGAVEPEDRRVAAARFDTDPRDTATPDAMTTLLAGIYRHDLLAQESAELLLDVMRRSTGEARLKGLLPAGTKVAHKTGSIGGTTNDVGLITLPNDTGHVAIAVFVKSSAEEVPTRERAIAEIGRAVYDFFLFSGR